jgi:hypothetical protein
MAAQVLKLSSDSSDRARASELLAQLLDEAPHEVDELLREQAARAHMDVSAVGAVLDEVAASAPYEARAHAVRAWLGIEEQGEEAQASVSPNSRTVQLKLPGSWFREYDDPVREHPLFLRYLPEMRLRLSWDAPPVSVVAEEALEPDGYQIRVSGTLRQEGRVDPQARYCTDAALPYLSAEARSHARKDDALGLQSIPLGDAPCGGLDELLTMPAVETVGRLLGEVLEATATPDSVDGRLDEDSD